MFKELYLPRWLLVYGVCVPLALMLGYLLASPFSSRSILVVGLVLVALAFPMLLRWHHPLLIFTWNAYLIVYFLPGQPSLGYTMAVVSLGFAILNRMMRRETGALYVPSVAWSLIFIGLVTVITAKATGGIGGRSLGGETWGAKRYVAVFCAIMGYFALVAQPVPKGRGVLYASVFMLSSMTAAFSDLIYAAGPRFYSLFLVFPSALASSLATTEGNLGRLSGIAFAAQSVVFFMIMRWGIRGLCEITKPWRLIFFIIISATSLLGGFRSMIILGLVLVLCQFWFERLYKDRLLIFFVVAFALLACGMFAWSDKLPLAVQRSLSFLPLRIDPSARLDAEGTLEWRLQMWKTLLPEVPKYLLLGKGFAYSGTDYYLTQEAVRRGIYTSYEDTLVNGNYHQGLLTLIIPFGIWGAIGLMWFWAAGLRVLYSNYRHGLSELQAINTFLISFFVARLIFYVLFYGQYDLDLCQFTGVVGMSIALNQGVRTGKSIAGEAGQTAPI